MTRKHILPLVLLLPLASSFFAQLLFSTGQQEPMISNGFTWLRNNQNADGSWGDEPTSMTTVFHTTSVVLETFHFCNITDSTYLKGIQWISGQNLINIDYVSRKAEALSKAGVSASAEINQLISAQNNDGGWGFDKGFPSDILDTILAVQALSASYVEGDVLENGVTYILNNQNADGGYGLLPNEESNVYYTSLILLSLEEYTYATLSIRANNAIRDASTWLSSQQQSNGGWIEDGNTVFQSSLATSALKITGYPFNATGAKSWIQAAQKPDGSWNSNAYETALALRALKPLPENKPPTAAFSFTPTYPQEGEVVQFTDKSKDPDGTIVTWSWDFGDGSTSDLQNPAHVYTTAGTYAVTLTVMDNDGTTDTATQTITVWVPTLNHPPELSHIGDKLLNEGTKLNITVFATDPDGDKITLSASGLPSFATFTDNGNGTGMLTLTPSFEDAGVYPGANITASDGIFTISESFTIAVYNVEEINPNFSQSEKIAVVPDTSGGEWTSELPTSGFVVPPLPYSPNFTSIGYAGVNYTNLLQYDTVILYQAFPDQLNASQKWDLIEWVSNGGKLIIWDADAIPDTNYDWLPYPFLSQYPGQYGYYGGNLPILADNQLGSSDPISPYYINTTDIVLNTDAVGDAKVFITYDLNWRGHMWGVNGLGYGGFVHTYAYHSRGIIIYSGLDADPLGTTGWLPQNPWLFKIYELELRLGIPPLITPPGPQALQLTLTVFVEDASTHTPLQGATVSADVGSWQLTNESGYAVLNMPPGTWTITVSNLGYFTVDRTITLNADMTISFDLWPVSPLLYSATVDAFCETESTYVSVGVTMDDTPTGFNTPQTFTDLIGTHTFTVPDADVNSHPFKQWSTGETSTTITVSSEGTYTAYYEAPPPPPPPTYDVTIDAHCNTEATDVSVAITMDGTPTGFNTPHTFTGLTGTHTVSVPTADANGHPFKLWSTEEATTTITINSAGTYIAYYEAPPPPPPPTYDVTIDAYCNTEAIAVNVAVNMDGAVTGFDTPHTFTGLIDTHTFAVPSSDANGHPFKQWSTGETSATITVSSGGTYTAYYEAPVTYTLTITTTVGGTTNPSLGSHTYDAGAHALVQAIPDTYYSFDHWELDGVNVGSTSPIDVFMDKDHTLHAVFTPITYNLTITATAGGTTNPTPETYAQNAGTTVQVQAIQDVYYFFDHWELDGTNVGSSNPITVTMDKDHKLHAVFAPITYTLTVTTTSGGTTNPTPGTYVHNAGSTVSVNAVPDTYYLFDHWELDGANVGKANPIDVFIDKDHVLNAVFTPITYTLTISATSGGTTDPLPGSYSYDAGAYASIRAVPDAYYQLDRWELDGVNVGSDNPIDVFMDKDHALHSVFTPLTYTLTITSTSGGTTDPAPGSHVYNAGTTVSVSAIANPDYRFDHWELDDANVGSINPYNITMDKDHTLRAVFVVCARAGKITGGGAVDKGTNFGFNVQSPDGITIKGQLEYQDKTIGINLHSVEIISLRINLYGTKGTFSGTATINGKSGFTFTVEVEDNGEPGNKDKFTITIPELKYTKTGTLTKGNIQIHTGPIDMNTTIGATCIYAVVQTLNGLLPFLLRSIQFPSQKLKLRRSLKTWTYKLNGAHATLYMLAKARIKSRVAKPP